MQNEFNLKIILLFLSLFILVCFSCKSQEKQTSSALKLKKTYYDEGKTIVKEQYYLNLSRLRDSLYIYFNTNGDTIRKGYYKNSRKHGLWEEPEFEKLTEQASRAYYYYKDDTLKKKVEKNWQEKNFNTLVSELTMTYADSVYKIHKTWAKGGEFIKSYSKRTYFDPHDLNQEKSNILSKAWYYNTNVLMFEEYRSKLKFQWYKLYSPEGKLYKHFIYKEDGTLETLTVYDENEKVEKVYNISKYKREFNKEKKRSYEYYYDENGELLPSSLFKLTYH